MPKHARSRDGCVNCKQKRIKCDETKPQCRNCLDRHLKCPGFSRQLKWKTSPAYATASTYGAQDSQETSHGHIQSLTNTTDSCRDRSGSRREPPSSYTAAQDAADLIRLTDHPPRTSLEDNLDQLLCSHPETLVLLNGDQCSNNSFIHHGRRPSDTPTVSVPSREPDGLDLECLGKEYSYGRPTSSRDTRSSNEQPYSTSTVWASVVDESSIIATADIQSLSKELSEASKHNAIAFIDDLTHEDDWLYETVNPNFATVPSLLDINDTAADELINELTGLDQPDSQTMDLSTILLENGARLDQGTKTALTTHYFDYICQIVSCFDSHESPFRADIPQKMLTCDYIYDCIVGMSAAHLANSVTGMEDIALRHQTRAMFALSPVINSVFPSKDKGSRDYSLVCSSTKTSRYHALLASLLLNMSSAWYNSSSTGLAHLFGARLLFQAWLVDEELTVKEDYPPLLTRQQSFIVGAMAFLECLAAIIIDQAIDVLKYLRPFRKVAENQRIYPNPWTGVSTPLFIVLAEAATLIRQKRNKNAMSTDESQAGLLFELDVSMTANATQLFTSALTHRTPSTARMEETKDAKTPLDHLIVMDCVFRLIVLLELSQIFPDVVLSDNHRVVDMTVSQTEARKVAVDFAIAALRLVSELPKTSGTIIMLSIPLISAGSALQNIESCRSNYNFDSTSFERLHKDVLDLINQPLPIAIWREQVEMRVELLERRVGLAPIRRMRELLKAVWHQADSTNISPGASLRQNIHWMDVMIDEKLETLLG